MKKPVILSLCDFSGRWSEPYRADGYEVIQVDLKHGHDARLFKRIDQPVYGVLAAPVCTAFSGAGALHWKKKEEAGNEQLLDGLGLVDACLRIIAAHDPVFWVMENPVGRLKDWIGPFQWSFQPSEFAGYLDDPDEDAYTKRTCLWGKFVIPEKKAVEPVHGSKMWAKYGGKSDRTKEMRSMTPRGFAQAFFLANNLDAPQIGPRVYGLNTKPRWSQ